MLCICRRFIPLGECFAKGRTIIPNRSRAIAEVPWAIGSVEGGHKEILSELGTVEDFAHLSTKAGELGAICCAGYRVPGCS